MGPATSTHFTRVVHVILMLVLHQSDVNFFVDVAGSCVYAAGPNLWTSRIAKTLHGDTGLYPRSPHWGIRGFFVLRDTRAFNTCAEVDIPQCFLGYAIHKCPILAIYRIFVGPYSQMPSTFPSTIQSLIKISSKFKKTFVSSLVRYARKTIINLIYTIKVWNIERWPPSPRFTP